LSIISDTLGCNDQAKLELRLLEAAQKMDIAPLSQETSSDADERIEAETFPCSFPYTWAMLLSRIYDVL
jgi:hypothetical protein